jgi:hypothetical protein
MNVADWNAIADAYSEIDDPEGRAALAFDREKLTTLQPKRLLGYGGGDGKFAVLCAESLPLQKIATYDPAPAAPPARERFRSSFSEDWRVGEGGTIYGLRPQQRKRQMFRRDPLPTRNFFQLPALQ